PSYRLEDVIREVARDEGHEAEPFALPTGLFLSVRSADGGDAHRMRRLFDWGVDLGRLMLIDEIFNDVAAKTTTIENERARIRGVVEKPPLYSSVVVWAAITISSGASAVFFRGTAIDVLVAAIVGAVIGAS